MMIVDNGLFLCRKLTCFMELESNFKTIYCPFAKREVNPSFLWMSYQGKGENAFLEALSFLERSGLDVNPSAISIDDLEECIDDGLGFSFDEIETVVLYFQKN